MITNESEGAVHTHEDEYDEVLHALKAGFNYGIADGTTALFLTDAEGLFDLYLDNLPSQSRQYHTC